jgi:hypothetical protein
MPDDPELARFLAEELGIADGDAPAGVPVWHHSAAMWVWRAKDGARSNAAWHFITIDGAAGEAISAHAGARGLVRRGGFSSVRVTATIGTTAWQTSLFPSRDPPGWLLPVKSAVRKAEGLAEGVAVMLTLRPA